MRRAASLLLVSCLLASLVPFGFFERDAPSLADGPLALFPGLLAEKGFLPFLPYYLLTLLLRALFVPAPLAMFLSRALPLAVALAALDSARRSGEVGARLLAGAPLAAVALAGSDPRHLAGAALCASAALLPAGPRRILPPFLFALLAPGLALRAAVSLPLFALPALLSRAARLLPPLSRAARPLARSLLLRDARCERRLAALARRAEAALRRGPARVLPYLLPALLLLCVALPRLSDDLWPDELFSAQFFDARLSAGEKAAIASGDVHPPLYYALLALAGRLLPAGPLFLRLPSLLLTLAGLHLTLLAARRATGGALPTLALGLLLALHPALARLASEARMYPLAFALGALLTLELERGRMRRAVAAALLLTWTHLVAALAALAALVAERTAGRGRGPGPAAATLLVISTAAFALFCATRAPGAPPGVGDYRPVPFTAEGVARGLLDTAVYLLHGVDARNHEGAVRALALPVALPLLLLFLPAALLAPAGRARLLAVALPVLGMAFLSTLFEHRAGDRYYAPLLPAFALVLTALPLARNVRRTRRALACLALLLFVARHALLFALHPACASGRAETTAAFVAATGGACGRVTLRDRAHLYDRAEPPEAPPGTVPVDAWVRPMAKGPQHAFELVRFEPPPPPSAPRSRPLLLDVSRLPLVRRLPDGTTLAGKLIDRESGGEAWLPLVKAGDRFVAEVPLSRADYAFLDLSFLPAATGALPCSLATFCLSPLPVFVGRGAAGRPHHEQPLPFEDPLFLWLPLSLALAALAHPVARTGLARLTGSRKTYKIRAK